MSIPQYSFSNSNSKVQDIPFQIKEVWADNFESELIKISKLLDKFPFVAMDTEFPGIIHNINLKSNESNYKNIKANVDDLKLIQCGISLSDERGNSPNDITTWQFNLSFSLKDDKYSNESITLLANSGINFDKLSKNGISPDLFGEVLTTSGLVLNEDIKWVSFHGSYDFAYLIKVLTSQPLPDTEIGFFELMRMYFPFFYDIRHMTKNFDGLSKSLQKLSQDLDIVRIGTQHQAGSDSIVTSKIFHILTSIYIKPDILKLDENILFGLGLTYEDEYSTLFDSSHSTSLINQSIENGNYTNTINSKISPNLEVGSYYPNQYLYPQQYYRGGNSMRYNYNFPQQFNSNNFPQNYVLPNDYLINGGMQNSNISNSNPEEIKRNPYNNL